jgi:DNA polymerase-3 subunit epsilon
MLGIEFKHHDALEDAKATGEVLLAAFSESGRSLVNWIEKLQERPERTPITAEVNPEGEWFGEVIVFTGELEIPRRQAAAMAANAGCRVDAGVTKETTLLVVGDQDLSQLNGHQKSAKHRKAESLIEKGQLIRILRESDFQEIANAAGSFK